MQRDETLPAELVAEPRPVPRRAAPPWLLRALPGVFAALLFGALALGTGVFGDAVRVLQAVLALSFVASVALQPGTRAAGRRLLTWDALPYYALLAGITLLALFLRTWGLRFGLPYLEHPDEWAVADEAVRMLQTGDYRPSKWDYPTLYMYLQVGVAAVHYLWGVSAGLYRELGDLKPEYYYPWMRALTALLGTAAIPLTYVLGRMLYGRNVGLAGAALLAVMPVAVGDAHYVTTDTPAMVFALGAMILIARLGLSCASPEPGRKRSSGGGEPLQASPLPGTVRVSGGGEPLQASPLPGTVRVSGGGKPLQASPLPGSEGAFGEVPHRGDPLPGGDIASGGGESLQASPLPPGTDGVTPLPRTGEGLGVRVFSAALLAGLATGLAAATKYNVAALLVALALALIMSARQRFSLQPSAFSLLPALLALLGVVLGFTLGMPLWFAELRNVLEGLASIVVHYRFEGHPGAESSRPVLFYWGALANEGLLIAFAMLAGLVLAFVRRSRADLLVLAFLLPSILQLAGVKVVFFRNIMPLLPLLCLLAASALAVLSSQFLVLSTRPGQPQLKTQNSKLKTQNSKLKTRVSSFRRGFVSRPGLLLATVVALVAAQPLARAFHDELLRSRPTTRVLATEWMHANAPAGSRVWLEDGTLLLPPDLRAEGGRPVTSNPPEWYRENGFRFLVTLLDRDDKDPTALAAFGEPMVRFERAGVRHGPTLAIWDTGVGDPAQEKRTAAGATLGSGALVLDGFRHPGTVRAGETLPLALYWQATRPLPADYTVFVHLLDAQGAKAAQRDVAPLGGTLPTSRWQPGQLLRDDQDLLVPAETPPGAYRLVAGMYDAATLAPITDGGPIDLGEVVVTR
jgi:4-amino-4-deoxy-L-arabinose transferase-like glycosyltransferase